MRFRAAVGAFVALALAPRRRRLTDRATCRRRTRSRSTPTASRPRRRPGTACTTSSRRRPSITRRSTRSTPARTASAPKSESATAFVTTLFADFRLWRGGELLVNPEMSGGQGLSSTLGVAAFPDGLVYRVGNPAPAIYIARLAVSQTFDLGGGQVRQRGRAQRARRHAGPRRPRHHRRPLLRRRHRRRQPLRQRRDVGVLQLGAVRVGRLRLSGGHARLHLGPAGGPRPRAGGRCAAGSRSSPTTRTSRRWTGGSPSRTV